MTENTPHPNTTIAGPRPQSLLVDGDEINLLDLLQVVADNLRLLVLGPIIAGLLAMGYSFTVTPVFTAKATFMPPQQQQSSAAAMLAGLGVLGGLAGVAGVNSPVDQYIAFLKSRSVQDALVVRFNLMERINTKSREAARSAVDGSVVIASGKGGIITIDASDKDPAFAAELANAHIEELGILLNRLAVTEAQQRRLFFEKQLANAKDNLVKAEQALKAGGINSNVLKLTPGASASAMATLKAAITAQEIKLASMRGYLTDSAPDFKQALTELAAMRSQIARAERAEPASSSVDSDYIARFRDYKYYESLFEIFIKQYEVARIDESREAAVIQVLDSAQPPERKSKPMKAQIAVQATLAMGCALLLFVFIRQALRSASQTPEFAEKQSHLRAAFSKAIGRGR